MTEPAESPHAVVEMMSKLSHKSVVESLNSAAPSGNDYKYKLNPTYMNKVARQF